MKNQIVFALSLAAACAFGVTVKVPLKEGWKFTKADDPALGTNLTVDAMSDVLDRADRGDFSGAPSAKWCAAGFDDSAWKAVRVPHDWGVEKSYNPDLAYGDAFLEVTGVGWYRLAFAVDGAKVAAPGADAATIPERGKVFFECDGAMSFPFVWINGKFVGGWPYGYTRFRLDLTPHLNRAGRNVIAVRCHNVPDSSRWYTGGGLYRNCRLLVCPEDYVVPGSVAVTTPEVTKERATVRVDYAMSKSGRKSRTFEVKNPRLWDVDDPHLYEVDVEGDRYRYGIRTIAFHADGRGFTLNGRTVPLNGVCMHHDFGVLGAAWNRSAQARRLRLFKEAGANAIRSSHNPPDEGLLALCDEMGIFVKDEVFDVWKHIGDAGKRKNGYHLLFDKWHERDLRAWIRTDRNHPSVIVWSLGNEICDGKQKIAPHEEYVERARHLRRIAEEEDATRPTTAANNNPVNFTNDFPTVLPLMGCNYFSWQYPALKAAHPNVPFFGSETICFGATRGEFTFPVAMRGPKPTEVANFHQSSYCWEGYGWSGKLDEGWAVAPDAQWFWMDKVGTVLGEFTWTGIDYLGGPYWCDDLRRNPRFFDPAKQARALDEVKRFGMTRTAIHSCNTGFFDLAGFKKEAFWLFQSRWRPNLPSAKILPHWNWPERVGRNVPVHVFTSGDEGELFLNGASLGRRKKQPGVWDRAYRLRWDDVVYRPGTLEVVVWKNGREWARDVVKTAGAPARLVVEAETDSLASDGESVAYVDVSVVDAAGTLVPRAAVATTFTVRGPAEIVATDNGDEADMADFHSPTRVTFNGMAQAIVRAKKGARGTATVEVSAPGFPAQTVALEIGN